MQVLIITVTQQQYENLILLLFICWPWKWPFKYCFNTQTVMTIATRASVQSVRQQLWHTLGAFSSGTTQLLQWTAATGRSKCSVTLPSAQWHTLASGYASHTAAASAPRHNSPVDWDLANLDLRPDSQPSVVALFVLCFLQTVTIFYLNGFITLE